MYDGVLRHHRLYIEMARYPKELQLCGAAKSVYNVVKSRKSQCTALLQSFP